MGWKSAGVLLLASLFVAGASVWTLGQVRDALSDANGLEGRFAAPEEGRPLDAGDVDWLSWAPDRTRVDPGAARDAFRALETQLTPVVQMTVSGPPDPVIDRVTTNWRSTDVLVGVSRDIGAPWTPADRCDRLASIRADLADLGWDVRFTTDPAIVTDYPIVKPRPVDITLDADSTMGHLEIRAMASGDAHVRYRIDEAVLAGGPVVVSALTPPSRIEGCA